jgi:hypothetical protein
MLDLGHQSLDANLILSLVINNMSSTGPLRKVVQAAPDLRQLELRSRV